MSPLSCLCHVKRAANGVRPDAPPAFVILEVVADRSGSMATLGDVPAAGLLNFMKQHQTLAQHHEAKTLFTLTTFDDVSETPIDAVDMRTWLCPSPPAVAQMIYPRGLTRLIDTFMERLHALERRLLRHRQQLPRKVASLHPKIVAILLVITDGQDNMSQTFTAADLNKRVQAAKRKGISVLFMGANQDAIRTAATFGVAAGDALTFGATPRAAGAAFRAATQATYRGVSSGHAPSAPTFTQAHRQSSAPVTYTPAPPPAAAPLPTFPAAAAAAPPLARPYARPLWRYRNLGQRAPFQSPPARVGGRGCSGGQYAATNALLAPAAQVVAMPPHLPPPAALTRMQTVAHTQS